MLLRLEFIVSFLFQPRAMRSSFFIRDTLLALAAGIVLALPIHVQMMHSTISKADTRISLPDLMGYAWYGQTPLTIEREKRSIFADATIDAARYRMARETRNLAPAAFLFVDDRIERALGISPLTLWYEMSPQAFRDALDVTRVSDTDLNVQFRADDADIARRGSHIIADLYVSSRMPVGSIITGTRTVGDMSQVMQPTRVTSAPTTLSHMPDYMAAGLGFLAFTGVLVMRRILTPQTDFASETLQPSRHIMPAKETRVLAPMMSIAPTAMPTAIPTLAPTTVTSSDQRAVADWQHKNMIQVAPQMNMSAPFSGHMRMQGSAPVMASTPQPALEQGHDEGDLIASADLAPRVMSHFAASGGRMQTATQPLQQHMPFASKKNPAQLIVVTSLGQDDAGHVAALRLGDHLAKTQAVVLVELDAHAEKLVEGQGVSDFLMNGAQFDDIIHPLAQSNVHLIPYGYCHHPRCDEHELFNLFMTALSKTYETIIVHVPSMAQPHMVVAMAHRAQLALVCTHEKNKKRALKSVVERLRETRVGEVMGVCTADMGRSSRAS
jgi:hypothetical protein